MTDEEIVTMTLREPALFRHIIERYESPLSRYVSRLGVKEVEDQQDVLQEIFIKVYRNLNGFDPSMKFSSWVYRIAHNEAISWYRKQNVRPEGHLIAESDEVLGLMKADEKPQEVLFDESIKVERITEALQKLDQKYRDVLILRYFEHLEYDEISDVLKIPIGSVGTLIHRGKGQLKKLIDPHHIRV